MVPRPPLRALQQELRGAPLELGCCLSFQKFGILHKPVGGIVPAFSKKPDLPLISASGPVFPASYLVRHPALKCPEFDESGARILTEEAARLGESREFLVVHRVR